MDSPKEIFIGLMEFNNNISDGGTERMSKLTDEK